jgi:hypothetical protein
LQFNKFTRSSERIALPGLTPKLSLLHRWSENGGLLPKTNIGATEPELSGNPAQPVQPGNFG